MGYLSRHKYEITNFVVSAQVTFFERYGKISVKCVLRNMKDGIGSQLTAT